MESYIRVIPDRTSDDADSLRQVVAALISAFPDVSERSPLKPHPRGGFSLFLELPKPRIEAVLQFLRDHGWLPCI